MSSESPPPDYLRLPVPDGKKPSEFTYRERRAELAQLMSRKAEPKLDKSQRELGDRYGVRQQQISKDLDLIRESMRFYIGDETEVRAELVFTTAVTELMDSGEYYKSAQLMKMWLDWQADLGHLERQPRQQQVEHSGQVDADVDHNVDPDAKVTRGLPEENERQFQEMIEAAERQTAATRVDENGDDLTEEDLGIASSSE